MFNFNAYCFCPDLISEKISDPVFFLDQLVPSTVSSTHHLLLDSEELLWLEYLERTRNNIPAYNNLKTWKAALEQKKNKILFSDTQHNGVVDPNFIARLVIKSPTTCRRYIVTNNNLSYEDIISELISQGIEILPEFNIKPSAEDQKNSIRYNATDFYYHLLDALELVASTRANKQENEHNDFLGALLSFKGYAIKDQARLGLSATGKNIGNLDIVVMQKSNWVTIIEPLRLTSIAKSNILGHYNKLIDNYNPLYLPNTHLVVYYIGEASKFNEFHSRYYEYVTALTPNDFNSDVVLHKTTNTKLRYSGIKSFVQQGTINGHDFSCSHTCIAFTG